MATRTFLAIVTLLLLAGCGATMVKEPRSNSAYGPVNAAELTGIVKYLNQGAASVIRSRREDAYKQMYHSCQGRYAIVREGPNVEGGVVITAANASYLSATQYWYIEFRCVR